MRLEEVDHKSAEEISSQVGLDTLAASIGENPDTINEIHTSPISFS